MKKILISLIVALFSAMSLAISDPLKVAFVYVSPIGNAGWTYQHDLGRKAIEERFGSDIEVKFVEDVKEGPDAERVIRKLASSGYDLIFATSFGYMEPSLKVAKMFPNKVFEHATGFKTSKNMGNYSPRFYEGRYLAGIAAGSQTKSNIIGYLAAFPIPEVVRGINAFTLGAQSVNPDIKVKVIWTNSWFDPGKESEVAASLIAQGADVLTHHTDSIAAVKTAQDKGVKAIAYHSDMQKHGKDAQIGAVVHNWEKFYTKRINQVLDGEWKPTSVWEGINSGMVDFIVTGDIDFAIQNTINITRNKIHDGTFNPFHGPIINQNGKTIINGEEELNDKDLSSMDYFVKGVEGKLSN